MHGCNCSYHGFVKIHQLLQKWGGGGAGRRNTQHELKFILWFPSVSLKPSVFQWFPVLLWLAPLFLGALVSQHEFPTAQAAVRSGAATRSASRLATLQQHLGDSRCLMRQNRGGGDPPSIPLKHMQRGESSHLSTGGVNVKHRAHTHTLHIWALRKPAQSLVD